MRNAVVPIKQRSLPLLLGTSTIPNSDRDDLILYCTVNVTVVVCGLEPAEPLTVTV